MHEAEEERGGGRIYVQRTAHSLRKSLLADFCYYFYLSGDPATTMACCVQHTNLVNMSMRMEFIDNTAAHPAMGERKIKDKINRK